MSEQPKTSAAQPRRDGHLVVYLAWPVLAGLALSVVLGVSIGGVVLFATRFDWAAAGTAAAVTFFVVLGLATVGVFLYVFGEWVGPRTAERQAEICQTVYVDEPEPPEPEPRFIPVGGRRRLNEPAPALPSGANRAGIREAMRHMVDRLAASTTVTTVNAEAATLEPDAPTWCKEMYSVLCACWPDKLARRDFQTLWPNGGTALWKKYVNGDGTGRHGGRGILATWNVIERADGRGRWQFVQPLDVIFSLDADLHRYATEMAERVQHSPSKGLALENAKQPLPNQTKPKNQTENQMTGGA